MQNDTFEDAHCGTVCSNERLETTWVPQLETDEVYFGLAYSEFYAAVKQNEAAPSKAPNFTQI